MKDARPLSIAKVPSVRRQGADPPATAGADADADGATAGMGRVAAAAEVEAGAASPCQAAAFQRPAASRSSRSRGACNASLPMAALRAEAFLVAPQWYRKLTGQAGSDFDEINTD